MGEGVKPIPEHLKKEQTTISKKVWFTYPTGGGGWNTSLQIHVSLLLASMINCDQPCTSTYFREYGALPQMGCMHTTLSQFPTSWNVVWKRYDHASGVETMCHRRSDSRSERVNAVHCRDSSLWTDKTFLEEVDTNTVPSVTRRLMGQAKLVFEPWSRWRYPRVSLNILFVGGSSVKRNTDYDNTGEWTSFKFNVLTNGCTRNLSETRGYVPPCV